MELLKLKIDVLILNFPDSGFLVYVQWINVRFATTVHNVCLHASAPRDSRMIPWVDMLVASGAKTTQTAEQKRRNYVVYKGANVTKGIEMMQAKSFAVSQNASSGLLRGRPTQDAGTKRPLERGAQDDCKPVKFYQQGTIAPCEMFPPSSKVLRLSCQSSQGAIAPQSARIYTLMGFSTVQLHLMMFYQRGARVWVQEVGTYPSQVQLHLVLRFC